MSRLGDSSLPYESGTPGSLASGLINGFLWKKREDVSAFSQVFYGCPLVLTFGKGFCVQRSLGNICLFGCRTSQGPSCTLVHYGSPRQQSSKDHLLDVFPHNLETGF